MTRKLRLGWMFRENCVWVGYFANIGLGLMEIRVGVEEIVVGGRVKG